MMRAPSRLIRCSNGAAAAEMALVTPLLITLMFGAFELGNYFLSEHAVSKAVRDGARYASRQGFTKYSCPSTVDPNGTGMIAQIQNLTRTGQLTGGNPRLNGWTDNNSVTVTLACVPARSGGVDVYSGIYRGMTDVPVVKVSASVAYTSLFQNLGFSSSTLLLHASSQSAVMGI